MFNCLNDKMIILDTFSDTSYSDNIININRISDNDNDNNDCKDNNDNERFDFELNVNYRMFLYILFVNTLSYISKYSSCVFNILYNVLYTINMYRKEFLITIRSNNGLRVCFISIFVATILTIYEIILFYAFVVPSINNEINKSIEMISNQLKQQIDIKFKIEPETLINILYNMNLTIPLKTFPYDYSMFFDYLHNNYYNSIIDISNNKINNLLEYLFNNNITKQFILGILRTLSVRETILVNEINNYTIITVSLLLAFLFFCLLIINNTLSERKEELGNFVWFSCILTITMILIFQYSFYIYANKYKYMGSTDTDELVYYIINQL